MDTPVRLPALIPEANIELVESTGWYLQTSPEICMKRLLASGVPKLFQICKCFRRGERGRRHLPEFSMLEWYRADADYRDLMEDCEALFLFIGEELGIGHSLRYGGHLISLRSPWDRITVKEAFQIYAPIDLDHAIEQDVFDETLVRYVEPCLGLERPVFLHDYPAALGALARLKQTNADLAERVELYVAGLELANGFSELTDAAEQRQRFVEERERISNQGGKPGPMPESFLTALSSMPAAAGMALGIDRLVMLFAGVESIDEVVSFTPEEL